MKPWDDMEPRERDAVTPLQKSYFLLLAGYLENGHGWWHPPSCLASWPIHEAFEMAQRHKERMTYEDLVQYYRDVGAKTISRTTYDQWVKDAEPAAAEKGAQ